MSAAYVYDAVRTPAAQAVRERLARMVLHA